MRQWLVCLSLLLLHCLSAAAAAAQTVLSPVAGQVTDPSGAPIAGAVVTVVSNGRTIDSSS
jgi:hypothetical protein